jgi:hypothetical protein
VWQAEPIVKINSVSNMSYMTQRLPSHLIYYETKLKINDSCRDGGKEILLFTLCYLRGSSPYDTSLDSPTQKSNLA